MTVSVPRLVVMTHNVWGDHRWTDRRAAFSAFYERHRPDLLCWQEYARGPAETLRSRRPELRLITDADVADDRNVPAQGAIGFDRTRFELVDRGIVPLPNDDQQRFLLWLQLTDLTTNRALVVATAHLTWCGLPAERAGGPNPRLVQAGTIVDTLDGLVPRGLPALFMGDLNDSYHAIRTLRESGFLDSFGATGEFPVPTFPLFPTAWTSPGWGAGFDAPTTVDWQMHRGPLAVDATQVVAGFHGDVAASDHSAVVTVYRYLDWDPIAGEIETAEE